VPGSPGRSLALPLAAAAVVAALLLALVLRLEGARGELWIDEVWTLKLLEGVSSIGGVVWGINHDNNHILNSMWLYLLGPDASTFPRRALSILFGSLSAGAAFAIGARRGMAEAFAAGILFAVAYPMVYFGSEARGYAGLILFALVAILILEREFSAPTQRHRVLLAAALAFAVLSQFIALAIVALLGFWTAWRAWRATRSFRQAEQATFSTFLPTLALMLLIGAAILFGATREGFQVGNVEAAGFFGALRGYGGLLSHLLGIPPSLPATLGLVPLAGALALAVALWRRESNPRVPLYVAGLAGLPAAMIAAGLPNLDLPRYFLPSGILFLLLVADLFGEAWRQRGAARAASIIALAAILVGNAFALGNFYEHRRSHFGEALALMAENAPTGRPIVYAADHDFRASTMVSFLASPRGLATTLVPDTQWCATPPDWLLYDPRRLGGRDAFRYEEKDCSLGFERLASWPGWGLSGPDLAVARRVP
jgi:hypothetical protein